MSVSNRRHQNATTDLLQKTLRSNNNLAVSPPVPLMPLFGKPKNSEAHRYYLLPGQGRGARKKFFQQLFAAILVGMIASALLGTALWFLNRR